MRDILHVFVSIINCFEPFLFVHDRAAVRGSFFNRMVLYFVETWSTLFRYISTNVWKAVPFSFIQSWSQRECWTISEPWCRKRFAAKEIVIFLVVGWTSYVAVAPVNIVKVLVVHALADVEIVVSTRHLPNTSWLWGPSSLCLDFSKRPIRVNIFRYFLTYEPVLTIIEIIGRGIGVYHLHWWNKGKTSVHMRIW